MTHTWLLVLWYIRLLVLWHIHDFYDRYITPSPMTHTYMPPVTHTWHLWHIHDSCDTYMTPSHTTHTWHLWHIHDFYDTYMTPSPMIHTTPSPMTHTWLLVPWHIHDSCNIYITPSHMTHTWLLVIWCIHDSCDTIQSTYIYITKLSFGSDWKLKIAAQIRLQPNIVGILFVFWFVLWCQSK